MQGKGYVNIYSGTQKSKKRVTNPLELNNREL